MERDDGSRPQIRLKWCPATLALCLAIALPAAGQAPPTPTLEIAGPAAVPLYTLGQYTVTGDPTAKVAWLVMPNTSQVVNGQSLVMTGPSGSYTIIAFAVVGGQPVILQQVVTVGAGPGPGPNPNPTPSPTTGPYWVGLVTDRTSAVPLTPAQLALQSSTTIAGSLKALAFGNQWSPSIDVSTPTIAAFAPAVKAAGTPCILVLGTNASGSGFKVEAFPVIDETSTLTEIKRLAAGGAPR